MNERRVDMFSPLPAMMPERIGHHRQHAGREGQQQAGAEERQQHQDEVAVLDLLGAAVLLGDMQSDRAAAVRARAADGRGLDTSARTVER